MQIAYCISFAALIFTGDLAGGFSLGLAGLIMGTVVTCVVIAVTSTFSPVVGGPDSPAVAVMSVLASSIAAALAAKGASTDQIILNVLVALSVSTLLTGILLYGIGALKLGQWLRFIPYPVIGGFLAASGILLLTGGMEVVTQTNLTLQPSSWEVLYSSTYGPQILIGALFAISIPVSARWVPAYLALPLVFFGFLMVLMASLFGFVHDEAVRSAWFLPSLGELSCGAHQCRDGEQVDWGVIAQSGAEIGSFCGVMAIALLLDVVEPRGGAPEDRRSRSGVSLERSRQSACLRVRRLRRLVVDERLPSARRVRCHDAVGRRDRRHRLRASSCSPASMSGAWCRRRFSAGCSFISA